MQTAQFLMESNNKLVPFFLFCFQFFALSGFITTRKSCASGLRNTTHSAIGRPWTCAHIIFMTEQMSSVGTMKTHKGVRAKELYSYSQKDPFWHLIFIFPTGNLKPKIAWSGVPKLYHDLPTVIPAPDTWFMSFPTLSKLLKMQILPSPRIWFSRYRKKLRNLPFSTQSMGFWAGSPSFGEHHDNSCWWEKQWKQKSIKGHQIPLLFWSINYQELCFGSKWSLSQGHFIGLTWDWTFTINPFKN